LLSQINFGFTHCFCGQISLLTNYCDDHNMSDCDGYYVSFRLNHVARKRSEARIL